MLRWEVMRGDGLREIAPLIAGQLSVILLDETASQKKCIVVMQSI